MTKAISYQDIFIQAIKASIGNLIWMKYLRAFNKQDNGIILIPHIREIQRVTNDDALKAYLTSFFCDDFLENDTISQYQYLIETIPSKLDDAIWDSILFDVESKLIERIDRMFLSNTKDCLVFIERTKSSPLFFGEDFDQLICPFILEESTLFTLRQNIDINFDEESINNDDGIYSVDWNTIVRIHNPLDFSPLYLNQKLIRNKRIMKLITFMTSTIIIELKNCFKIKTSNGNQINFYKIR